METAELEYELPPELIAQRPAQRRDESRLLVYERATGDVRHRRFSDLPDELAPGELVVVNESRVIPARLHLERPDGGEAEVLLLERVGPDGLWEGLARPSRRLRAGQRLGPVELLESLGRGRWLVRLEGEPAGEMPLPPYITEPLAEPERYQTVYAQAEGSAAAPTAGLHFTPELLRRLDVARVTLHVGLDTFRPIETENLAEHEIHSERYEVAPEEWERIKAADRVLAVGTTTVRVLETVASNTVLQGRPEPSEPSSGAVRRAGAGESNTVLQGRTGLFITPGYEFKRVDSLLTNFHLPRSTLLALVMAFTGVEETRRLYELAIEERYRFYSFGDAMLIR
jgi:S-adenosylmethionine:tRNA ribosyltransferase-isomerase